MKRVITIILLTISSIGIYSNGTMDRAPDYPREFDIDEDRMHRIGMIDIVSLYTRDIENEFDLWNPIFCTLDYSSEGGFTSSDGTNYSKVIFIIYPSIRKWSNDQVYVFRVYENSGDLLTGTVWGGKVRNPLTIEKMKNIAEWNIAGIGI